MLKLVLYYQDIGGCQIVEKTKVIYSFCEAYVELHFLFGRITLKVTMNCHQKLKYTFPLLLLSGMLTSILKSMMMYM